VASPSAALGVAPTPALAPVPTKDNGPCGTGRIELYPQVEPTDGSLVARFRPPVGGLLAAAIEQGPSDGSIVVSRTAAAATVSSVVATFHGRAIQDPYG